jgi:hypothetical protein
MMKIRRLVLSISLVSVMIVACGERDNDVVAPVDAPNASFATSASSFFDNFENPALPQWAGKSGGPHHGVVVDDPLRPGNHVLTFTALNGAGDIFGTEVTVLPGAKYILSFEYLGIYGGPPAVPGDLGGFIGFADEKPGNHIWLAATVLSGGAQDDPLIDDGQWRSYAIEFDPFAYLGSIPDNAIGVMIEDWVGSAGVPGDAYFDNVRLSVMGGLDIRPGSCPNPLNPRSMGVVPLAIVGTEDFDVHDIDVSTVLLEGVAPLRSSIEDVTAPATDGGDCPCTTAGPDGIDDLTLKVTTQELVAAISPLPPSSAPVLTVTGQLLDGTPFEFSDCMRIVGKPKEPRVAW